MVIPTNLHAFTGQALKVGGHHFHGPIQNKNERSRAARMLQTIFYSTKISFKDMKIFFIICIGITSYSTAI